MAIKITQRAVVTEDMPSGLLTLKLPPGTTLDNWVKDENQRIKDRFPEIKHETRELGPELAEMLRIAKHNKQLWEQRYELIKLQIREELQWARKGTADDLPFIGRRIFHVKTFETPEHTVDALFPL
jgi:hypothetical protein